MEQQKNKVGVIGDTESVMGFLALGFTVAFANDADYAEVALKKMAADPSFAIIFLTENYAIPLTEVIDKYKDKPTPAIVTIPSADGKGKGYGLDMLHKAVERAVGADILD